MKVDGGGCKRRWRRWGGALRLDSGVARSRGPWVSRLATSNTPSLASAVVDHKKTAAGRGDLLLQEMVERLRKSSGADSGGGDPGITAAFGLPEHAVDFFDSGEKLFSLALVDMNLAGAAKFRRFPERVVEIGERCQVLGLEVIGPKDQEFFLGLLGFIFLDRNKASEGVESSVVVSSRSRSFKRLELLGHREHCFSVDTS